jgi:WD40 repeat protein
LFILFDHYNYSAGRYRVGLGWKPICGIEDALDNLAADFLHDFVLFSPDGTRIASGSLDHTIKLWDAASGGLLRTSKGHSDSVRTATDGFGQRASKWTTPR